MTIAKRGLFSSVSAALLLPATARAARRHDVGSEIAALFQALPGVKTWLIHAPAAEGAPELTVSRRPDLQVFVGSAFKAFVLCERLRQLDGPRVVERLQANLLPLDASVWNLSSPMFDPPNLSGKAPERTAAEAMIMHSDNTGTDMVMAATHPSKVRSFIAGIGLTNTLIPDSTRSFLAYLLGFPNFRQTTWAQVNAAAAHDAPFVNPPLNTTQTLASSAADLVAFYTHALQGAYFKSRETLAEFRRILSIADAVARVVPVGASGYIKGGSIDVPGFHALCVAGGMAVGDRWVYFAITLNWQAPALQDPDTVNAWAAAVASSLQAVYDTLA